MQLWQIPVTWTMCGIVAIEAETLADGMELAKDAEGTLPLPTDASYVDGSWQLSSDDEGIVQCYQQSEERGVRTCGR